MALCFFVVCISVGKRTPIKRGRSVKKTTDTRVYLERADQLSYDSYSNHPDAQFLKGHVSFRHKGARLTCDSAYYYQESNSFQAFGHVKLRQGDTLTLTSDYAYYDGNDEMAEARKNVILTHRKSKLYCDSLNFDRMYGIGYFFEGGTLVDSNNRLTSDWGQYSTSDRHAIFYYNVRLRNNKFLMEGDTLHYETTTGRAHMTGPTKITNDNNIVHSADGYYNTRTEYAELYGRSTVVNKDGKEITADSLYHNSKDGISEGFGNVVYKDTLNKNIMNSGYFHYNENTGNGLGTRDAVVMDYSQGDTLYMHADTMRIETFYINTDSVYRMIHCYPHVRAYRTDVQAVCDSLVACSADSSMTMYRDPVVWNMGRQLLGEQIIVYSNDSTIRFAHVSGQALSVEMLNDSIHYNQISSKEMKAWFTDGALRLNQAEGNVQSVYYPIDDADSTLIGLDYMETDTMRMYLSPERRLEKIWACKHKGTLYPISQIPPAKYFLDNFAWFDYMRPVSKDDIYEWRPKKGGMELKPEKRRDAPLQYLKPTAANTEEKTDKEAEADVEGGEVNAEKSDSNINENPVTEEATAVKSAEN